MTAVSEILHWCSNEDPSNGVAMATGGDWVRDDNGSDNGDGDGDCVPAGIPQRQLRAAAKYQQTVKSTSLSQFARLDKLRLYEDILQSFPEQTSPSPFSVGDTGRLFGGGKELPFPQLLTRFSALNPSIRAKEPLGVKSKLRTYMSAYKNITPQLRQAAKGLAMAPDDVGRRSVNPIFTRKNSKDPKLIAFLQELMAEIDRCRRKLLESGRL